MMSVKSKNIYVFSTEKPSRLYQLKNNILRLDYKIDRGEANKHIYITSDEEIKDGDWYILHLEDRIVKRHKQLDLRGITPEWSKKIILTTDQDLINDGVQAIGDEFLEWFVKNPSCEEFEVKKEYITPLGDIVETCYDNERLNYKIIIPKEEAMNMKEEFEKSVNIIDDWLKKNGDPEIHKQETQGYICPQTKKQCDDECCVSAEDCHIEASFGIVSDCEPPKQETLEEAINNEINNIDINSSNLENIAKYNRISGTLLSELKKSMANIAKWQQERMHSEEEVVRILIKAYEGVGKRKIPNQVVLANWFEQFKK